MDTDSSKVQVKSKDLYEDIAKDVAKRFYALNFELEKQLPKGKNKNLLS